jgi:hypothetical protein
MFYLGSQEFPTTADELATGLTAAFDELFSLPPNARVVTIVDGDYPALQEVRIELTGAMLNVHSAPPKPVGVGPRARGVTVGRLEMVGRPVRVEQAALHLELTARDARFDFDRTAQGRAMLTLASAAEGRVEASIRRGDLETLLLAGAQEPARAQGVVIDRTALTLASTGPRSIMVDLGVTARKRVLIADVTAVVRINGRLDVSDELVARLSGLTCHGDGVVGSIVCSFLAPHLQKFEGHELPLMAFSLGDVRLRDLQIGVVDGLQVTAAFGG